MVLALVTGAWHMAQRPSFGQLVYSTYYESPYLCSTASGQPPCPWCNAGHTSPPEDQDHFGCDFGEPPAGWPIHPCMQATGKTAGCFEQMYNCGNRRDCITLSVITSCFDSYTVCN